MRNILWDFFLNLPLFLQIGSLWKERNFLLRRERSGEKWIQERLSTHWNGRQCTETWNNVIIYILRTAQCINVCYIRWIKILLTLPQTWRCIWCSWPPIIEAVWHGLVVLCCWLVFPWQRWLPLEPFPPATSSLPQNLWEPVARIVWEFSMACHYCMSILIKQINTRKFYS